NHHRDSWRGGGHRLRVVAACLTPLERHREKSDPAGRGRRQRLRLKASLCCQHGGGLSARRWSAVTLTPKLRIRGPEEEEIGTDLDGSSGSLSGASISVSSLLPEP